MPVRQRFQSATFRFYRGSERGFTLIEVLVAVLVLSVGLLGLAGLQIIGQRSNHSAYLRSQAVLQAYGITDRMRANREGITAGSYDKVSGIGSKPDCISTGCTPAQLAQYDAFEWNSMNAAVLPLGQGTVTSNGASGTFTITVAWDDNRDGAVNTNDPTFSMEFRP